ncbi:hypothetical protein [Aquipseudomonas guryensis]|jgi:hypothetical protein|uniref:Uncharacterized protein n=1 Tax=Aquipseudomonas guryensis TaxID=2759165 RepID=A0A7W4H3C2_9GAMM|nr:hypothetical protein [Pseudomonas guryensis]MBB1519385.1 hypothetical protein [Pseudomonas guryensis]
MRLFIVFALSAGLLQIAPLSAADLLRRPTSGSPGTATPQPYSQPQIRPLGSSNRNPPLLNSPAQPRPLTPPQPLPKDRPLPQLEQQRKANPQHPAEQLD